MCCRILGFTKVDHILQNKTQLSHDYLTPPDPLSTTLSVLCPKGKPRWAIEGVVRKPFL